ncbi:type I restriction enzyme, S subunit [Vibrio crassostreae]|nr:type I restriction enzyme, S subunit [Vibrio crassostreae]CAK3487320.1 type I restriction enzyme, S subunit [Vibrio crassostreae]CAK3507254.1 type I restriction enzyme, S subunit [Vibrio crassostreae]CAK3543960.1 type I restriction enzyme, S subunit [Vibrio crassostreae]CAK3552847.1 type I restriction enzyme, S subunit [Vibrio crassostreae]
MSLDQTPINQLITDNIDTWTSTVKTKATTGRGSSKKQELYGVKRLRELILELAVRGKLVPQDPNDEPASVLLKQVADKKAELIAAKKIRRAKTAKPSDMPAIDFSKPNGWELVRVEELVVNSSDNIVDGPFGSKLKAIEYVDTGIPIIRIQNVDRNRFKHNGLQFLTPEKAAELERHSYISGDIVLNKLGEPTGKACIVPDSLEQGIIVADIVRIRLDAVVVDKEFLTLAINSPFVANQFSGLAKGVTRQRVNLSQIRSLSLPIPPAKEQIEIVDRVNHLMTLCDQLEQQTEASIEAHQVLVTTLLDTLTNSTDADELMQNWARISEHFDTLFTTEESIDQLKQTILQLAVMGKLVPQDLNDEPATKLLERIAEEKALLIKEKKIKKQKALPPITDDEKPFELPSGWEWCRIFNASLFTEYGSSEKTDDELIDGVPVLKMGDIQGGRVILGKKKVVSPNIEDLPSLYLRYGDILYNRTNSPELVGKTGMYEGEDDVYTFASYLIRIRCSFDNIMPQYLSFCMNSPYFRETQINPYIKQQCGQANVNGTLMKNMLVPIPPLCEQVNIVKKINEMMELCEKIKMRMNINEKTQLMISDTVIYKGLTVCD